MEIDFALILVIATFASGLIWAADVLYFRRRREAAAGGASVREPVLVEYSRAFFPIILIVLLIRSFAFEPFRIPSSSMVPTLLVGDFIFVNKWVYGLRLPVTNTKIVQVGEPQRGDVVVFRLPSDPSTNYIKRVVGLPGDVVTYKDRRLYINGELVPAHADGEYHGREDNDGELMIEMLGTHEHEILLSPFARSREGTFRVPEGHYFFMGDNRDNSRDSRYPGVGFVPEDLLVGKAERIWLNWDWTGGAPIWSRIGDKIE